MPEIAHTISITTTDPANIYCLFLRYFYIFHRTEFVAYENLFFDEIIMVYP